MQEIRDKYYYKDAKKRNTVVYEKENKDMNSFKERFSYNDYKNSKVVRKRIESGYNNLLGSCLR